MLTPQPLGAQPTPQSAAPMVAKCQVIPARGEPPCTRAGRLPRVKKGEAPRAERGENCVLCREHDNERLRVYFKYKSAAAEANQLGMRIAQDTGRRRRPIERLGREEVDAGIAMREKYARLIEDELRERENHRRRFVVEVDAGHAAWLMRRQEVRAANRNALDRLRQRREVLVAQGVYGEERKREQEEERKHQEDVERMRRAMTAMRQQEEADKQHAERRQAEQQEEAGQKQKEETCKAEEARAHEEEVEKMRQRMAAMRQEEADRQQSQR